MKTVLTTNIFANEEPEQAENMVECLTKQLVAVEGISEDLKSYNQMKWVRRMNSIRNRVDEVVLTEVVYKI